MARRGLGMYLLDENGNPVPCSDSRQWAQVFDDPRRVLKQTKVGILEVSTVFLGLDHNHSGQGDPVLWETMIFSEDSDYTDHYCDRYTSREAAYEGHQRAVDKAKADVEKAKAVAKLTAKVKAP